MVTLQDALPVGYEAAVMAQTAKTEQEWYAVAKQWLERRYRIKKRIHFQELSDN
jgi:hypothetical protein